MHGLSCEARAGASGDELKRAHALALDLARAGVASGKGAWVQERVIARAAGHAVAAPIITVIARACTERSGAPQQLSMPMRTTTSTSCR